MVRYALGEVGVDRLRSTGEISSSKSWLAGNEIAERDDMSEEMISGPAASGLS